ncbi:Phosphoserine phosphatase like protein [Argiope bruennichi]|uniref:Phosphoserine phosphatase like protein n=1 Tax=Argiope bruennichi TaxID=94029 RepID=A0A8T0E572_ARGBR|nr:Phosphoserine phosphatase like protein [Argiope bruennichi]
MGRLDDRVKSIWRSADAVCFDIDSTVCTDEAIDELAKFVGREKEVAELKLQENLYQILMDHTLNPTPSERAEAFRSFRCCKWSPKGAAGTGRCLLATLTMDHRLALYEEVEKEWKCICDLTELLKKEIVPAQSNNVSQPKPTRTSRRRKKRGGRGRGKRTFVVLDDTEEEEESKEVFSISKSLNYEKIRDETYKYAPMGFLMCGSLKGILGFLPVAVVMAEEELTVSVKNLCKVWDEEDHMAVDHISVLKIALRKYICIAAKMHALIGCEILLTEDSIMIRNVGHSFGLHRLPVTEIKFQHDRLSIDLDLKNYMIQGLALSQMVLIWGIV